MQAKSLQIGQKVKCPLRGEGKVVSKSVFTADVKFIKSSVQYHFRNDTTLQNLELELI